MENKQKMQYKSKPEPNLSLHGNSQNSPIFRKHQDNQNANYHDRVQSEHSISSQQEADQSDIFSKYIQNKPSKESPQYNSSIYTNIAQSPQLPSDSNQKYHFSTTNNHIKQQMSEIQSQDNLQWLTRQGHNYAQSNQSKMYRIEQISHQPAENQYHEEESQPEIFKQLASIQTINKKYPKSPRNSHVHPTSQGQQSFQKRQSMKKTNQSPIKHSESIGKNAGMTTKDNIIQDRIYESPIYRASSNNSGIQDHSDSVDPSVNSDNQVQTMNKQGKVHQNLSHSKQSSSAQNRPVRIIDSDVSSQSDLSEQEQSQRPLYNQQRKSQTPSSRRNQSQNESTNQLQQGSDRLSGSSSSQSSQSLSQQEQESCEQDTNSRPNDTVQNGADDSVEKSRGIRETVSSRAIRELEMKYNNRSKIVSPNLYRDNPPSSPRNSYQPQLSENSQEDIKKSAQTPKQSATNPKKTIQSSNKSFRNSKKWTKQQKQRQQNSKDSNCRSVHTHGQAELKSLGRVRNGLQKYKNEQVNDILIQEENVNVEMEKSKKIIKIKSLFKENSKIQGFNSKNNGLYNIKEAKPSSNKSPITRIIPEKLHNRQIQSNQKHFLAKNNQKESKTINEAKHVNLKPTTQHIQNEGQRLAQVKSLHLHSPQKYSETSIPNSLFYSQNKNNPICKSPTNSNHSLQKITELQHELIQKIDHLELIIKDLSSIRSNLHQDRSPSIKSPSVKSVKKSPYISPSNPSQITKRFINQRLQQNYQVRLENGSSSFHRPVKFTSDYSNNTSTTRQINRLSKFQDYQQRQSHLKNSLSKKNTKPNEYFEMNFKSASRINKSKEDREMIQKHKESHPKMKGSSRTISSKQSSDKSKQFHLEGKQTARKTSLLDQIRILKQKVQALEDEKRLKRQNKLKIKQKSPQKQIRTSKQNLYQHDHALILKSSQNEKGRSSKKITSVQTRSINENNAKSQRHKSPVNQSEQLSMKQVKRQARLEKNKFQNQKNPITKPFNQDYFPSSPPSHKYGSPIQKSPNPTQNKISYEYDNQTKNDPKKDLLISYQVINEKQYQNESNLRKGFNIEFLNKPISRHPPLPDDNQQILTKKALNIYKKLQGLMKVDFSQINQLFIQKHQHCVTFEISSTFQGCYNIIWEYPSHSVFKKTGPLLYCGQLRQTKTNSILAKLKHGQGVQILEQNYFYKGSFKHNLKHGPGVIYYSNGDIYFGQWKDNFMNGRGVYITFQGDVYEGSFTNNKKNGYGVEKFRNQDHYKGFYRKGVFHGQGTFNFISGKYKWSNGSSYKGDFSKGHLHGKGVWKSGEGDFYEGDYFMDEKHGFGRYVWKNAVVYEGPFQNGYKSGESTGKTKNY